MTDTTPATSTYAWWQKGIVYQIYSRSFQDSNADGIGDLRGITTRLEYLAWLGIDAIWLSPIYTSPMVDFGYDVSDYTGIDPMFGTLDDFDAMMKRAHDLGLKVIMDFVPNHTSDQHPWFIESRSSRNNPKRDWYIWRDGRNEGPPTNWLSEFGGPAWTYDPVTFQHYYHAYLAQQPDLNWRNPDVRAAMHDAMRFWLDRGVDGFRLDTIEHLIEDNQFHDNPPNPDYESRMPPASMLIRRYTTNQPDIHEALMGLHAVTDTYPNRALIGETYLPLEQMVGYYAHGIHLPFNFNLIGATWTAANIAQLIKRYEALLPAGGWPNWVLGNHDRMRIASFIGRAQARIAAMLLLTLRGTPTLYYGDELGLQNVDIPQHRVQDPWEKNLPGLGFGRDPVRTPMPWDATPNAGFTTATPWLPLNADWQTRNVAAFQCDDSRMLALYRNLITLRKNEPALSIGAYGKITAQDDVLVYERVHDGRTLCIYLNFDAASSSIKIARPATILLSTRTDRIETDITRQLDLQPNEGVVTVCAATPSEK
ncbi:MAG: DUF3459 domain-containing protein [Rhodospirillaceae bacterium]|nr:DUF3459 domain-containing protein [Rhodospirillaceae bacterium]